MSSSTTEASIPRAHSAAVSEDALTVDLIDGRRISVPLAWYPRLAHAGPEERGRWRLIAQGEGIHWPDLDEDIRVADLVAGRASTESQRSFQQWLQQRQTGGAP